MANTLSITDIPAINRLNRSVPTYEQQTFLGASISSFTATGGFGDSSSTLGVELVVDEYNSGDATGLGLGQDVYHNGIKDNFIPPPVGSPVFFAFGNTRKSVQDAFYNVFDQYYGTGSPSASRHFTFGGILQSYTQNKSSATYAMYSVQVVDPREILSNVQLILNNYAGSIFGCDNVFNIYGFLEYNSPSMSRLFASSNADPVTAFGTGSDMWYSRSRLTIPESIKFYNSGAGQMFPLTGTGLSRRMPQGIPYYRVAQAINAFSSLQYPLPLEYKEFGGYVNFRGMKYIIDLSSLPQLPPFYFLDYDQISVLDLCLEICDATNRDLYVTLLPIISHPACPQVNTVDATNLVAGIIKVDAIDRSSPPAFGSIKNFIDTTKAAGTTVENQDIGFELSNAVTDKFLAGAQEVDMYFFSAKDDRANNTGLQWTLDHMYQQQILPYYGLIGNKAVTIPKGFGPYQQILLDSSNLMANGVGNYYVATEMELRCALVSFERWSEFLMMYNDLYMESIESNDIRDIVTASNTAQENPALPPVELSTNYAVTVPRSVWPSDRNTYDSDGFPSSPCNPPYGYPLYYKRATQIGLPQAGLANITAINTRILTQLTQLKNATGQNFIALLNSIWKDLSSGSSSGQSASEKAFYQLIKNAVNGGGVQDLALIEHQMNNIAPIVAQSSRIAKKNTQNAMRVYNFVKNIAEECLGKKFLVKIPQAANSLFNDATNPFGFPARNVKNHRIVPLTIGNHLSAKTVGDGALDVNYNPLNNLFEFNYAPENQGGFPSYYSHTGSSGVNGGFIPMDISNFKNDNGRISAYVRFNNSQHLSFDSIPRDSFTQQLAHANYFIPDVAYQLDNAINISNTPLDPKPENEAKTIAFVKCDVDDKFYMPPISAVKNLKVHGRQVKFKTVVEKPKKFFDAEKCKEMYTYPFSKRLYYPDPYSTADNTNSFDDDYDWATDGDTTTTTTMPPGAINAPVRCFIIPHPNAVSLDLNNVYALITLPNRIIPTVTSRYRDAMSFKVNAANIRHFLGLDVVTGLTGFDEPAVGNGTPADVASNITGQSMIGKDNVEKIINKTYDGLTFSLPNRISVSSPSPVYPDLVVLPLRSKERCYGPWISSSSSVGGKIDFVKDENLAPWNYGGYTMMNQIGKLQAELAYSVSLISERGGFVVPDIPVGAPLGRALVAGGPLITSISVEVSQNGIRSTYKMDSYTQSFGKMQKQREHMISNISRNIQRQNDERNALIRQGIGKNQTNINYNKIYRAIENQQRSSVESYYSNFDKGTSSFSNSISMSVLPRAFNGKDVDSTQALSVGQDKSRVDLLVDGSFMSAIELQQGGELMANNPQQFSASYFNSAASNVSDIYAPASLEPDHPHMSYMPNQSLEANANFYKQQDGRDNDKFTQWGIT